MKVAIKRLSASAKLPLYMTSGAAGADLYADLTQPLLFAPGEFHLVPTGLAIAVPLGFEGQVRSRSGLAKRVGLVVLNQPGTIDSDYRGEVSLLLVNLGTETYQVLPGDRIAQLIIAPVARGEFEEVTHMERTCRNGAGWGSTGA